ncbi:MAG TPA: 2-phospho-L-lactate transferase CofD family protein, partial [Woeseiaceae bacterium]|nr:2-phospho-L-lactate transferase CofD family protein [Woeseiaceae bacterium]
MNGGRILALSGGVGGTKLAVGLAGVLPSGTLTVVGNTGDDFEYLGLHVSPDVDTLLYTLAGLADPDTGWGRRSETWSFLSELERLGEETWFRIGDKDLAVHVWRTHALRARRLLSTITAELCTKLRAAAEVLPMSDDPVRTVLDTDAGPLA